MFVHPGRFRASMPCTRQDIGYRTDMTTYPKKVVELPPRFDPDRPPPGAPPPELEAPDADPPGPLDAPPTPDIGPGTGGGAS